MDSNTAQAEDFDPTGWELALVTTPSTNISAATERQLVWRIFLFQPPFKTQNFWKGLCFEQNLICLPGKYMFKECFNCPFYVIALEICFSAECGCLVFLNEIGFMLLLRLNELVRGGKRHKTNRTIRMK